MLKCLCFWIIVLYVVIIGYIGVGLIGIFFCLGVFGGFLFVVLFIVFEIVLIGNFGLVCFCLFKVGNIFFRMGI